MEEIASAKRSFPDYLLKLIEFDFHLTPRQEQICEFLCQGFNIPAIAKSISRSPNTIERHIQEIKEKTNINSTTAIVCWFSAKKVQKLVQLHHIQATKTPL